MSERREEEVQLEDDHRQPSTINVESFVDEQEWRLYHEVETFQGVVNKFYEGDATEMCAHPSFSCRTHASRRPGFYITNIFVVMVTLTRSSNARNWAAWTKNVKERRKHKMHSVH